MHGLRSAPPSRDAQNALRIAAAPPPTSSLLGQKKKRSVNLSRERRKEELEHLKHHVVELQNQLNSLQRRRDELLRPHLAGETGEFKTTAPVWEYLARRQFEAHKRAAEQTAHLKCLLATQTQTAEELIRLIHRAQQIEQDAVALPLGRWPSLSVESGSVADQLARLRILCGQWFVAFSWHAPVRVGEIRFFESKVVSDNGSETVMDIYANQSFPFSVGQVETAIWTILQAECVEDDFLYTQRCEASSKHTLVAKYATATDKDGRRGALQGTYVSHRFRNEQGHFLIASNVSASSEGTCREGAKHHFSVTEDCWIRIVDARELSDVIAVTESMPPLTVLQHVRRSCIRSSGTDNCADDARRQAVVDLHRTLVEEELRWGQESIEIMLIRGGNLE